MAIKIAMIADYPEISGQIDGGVQAVTSYLVHAMTRCPDIELHVISFRLGLGRTEVIKEQKFVRYSIPYGKFGTLTRFRKDQANLGAFLNEIGPDIVHSQGGGHQGILASRSGYPTVITIHGILAQEAKHLQGFRRRTRTRIQGLLGERHYIRHAKHTILINPYVADHYGSTLTGKCYAIPNPVDHRFFDVVRNEKPDRILFAGRLYKLKGVKNLLQAVSRLTVTKELQLVLAGSLADKDYVSELRGEADRLGLTDIIDFRGILGTDQFLEELATCACLVLPSYQETAPMVIQEAMASGVPVVASDICGIPYQVDEAQTGFLVPPGDVEILTDRLNTLLSDAGMRKRFGAAARIRAENEYRADVVAKKTIDVYKEMLQ